MHMANGVVLYLALQLFSLFHPATVPVIVYNSQTSDGLGGVSFDQWLTTNDEGNVRITETKLERLSSNMADEHANHGEGQKITFPN